MEFLIKTLVAGAIVATVSTVSQRAPTLGALLLGVPFLTLISFSFLHFAGTDVETYKQLCIETFIFVSISFVFFLVFYFMIPNYNFWIVLLSSLITCMVAMGVYLWLTK